MLHIHSMHIHAYVYGRWHVLLRQKAHFFFRTCSSHEWLSASLATTGHELGLSRVRSGGTDLKQHRRAAAREKTCMAELLPRVWRMQGGGIARCTLA